MLNHEGSHHEHFEELCAIAASGQISESEFVELQDHLQQCEVCRSAYSDFVDLLHDKLPLAHPEIAGSSKLPGFLSETSSHRERFLARARMEGVAVSLDPARRTVQSRLSFWFSLKFANVGLAPIAVAALLVTAALLSYGLYESNLRYEELATRHAELSRQFSQRQPVTGAAPTKPDSAPEQPPLIERRYSEAELARVRTESAAAETRSQILDDQLTKVTAELAALRTNS